NAPMIRFSCPACQTSLKAADRGQGRKVACPRCGQRLRIPARFQVKNRTLLGRPRNAPCIPSETLEQPIQPLDSTTHDSPADEQFAGDLALRQPRIKSLLQAVAIIITLGCLITILIARQQLVEILKQATVSTPPILGLASPTPVIVKGIRAEFLEA